ELAGQQIRRRVVHHASEVDLAPRHGDQVGAFVDGQPALRRPVEGYEDLAIHGGLLFAADASIALTGAAVSSRAGASRLSAGPSSAPAAGRAGTPPWRPQSTRGMRAPGRPGRPACATGAARRAG